MGSGSIKLSGLLQTNTCLLRHRFLLVSACTAGWESEHHSNSICGRDEIPTTLKSHVPPLFFPSALHVTLSPISSQNASLLLYIPITFCRHHSEPLTTRYESYADMYTWSTSHNARRSTDVNRSYVPCSLWGPWVHAPIVISQASQSNRHKTTYLNKDPETQRSGYRRASPFSTTAPRDAHEFLTNPHSSYLQGPSPSCLAPSVRCQLTKSSGSIHKSAEPHFL